MHAPFTLTAPAKLNLWLRLTGAKRPDGRHELESHFAPLALADTLTCRPAGAFTLHVDGPFCDGVPTDESNLLHTAFYEFCAAFGAQPALEIHLTKNIPHAAGLGGGSSDAGALLTYLTDQTPGLTLNAVRAWSLRLGADVPAAMGPHSGHVSGVGEVLGANLDLPTDCDVLLVKPAAPCPTGAVFQALGSAGVCDEVSVNDLEAAACQVCPEVGSILNILRAHFGAAAQMTGSGSTCFALISAGENLSPGLDSALAAHWVHRTQFRQD